ncbi:class I SAM-dependent methyltransferase [Streptomyces lavendofoliae]|uniref:class I SAM-dependent methyltransferase n=1 Tax=Streptomyces lavendofoliae TaxID=67314 RepID=UPI003D8AECD7
MQTLSWSWGVATAGLGTVLCLVIDAMRLRRRARHLTTLTSPDKGDVAAYRFITAGGVHLDDHTRRAACHHAEHSGLHVVDLIPGDLPAHNAMELMRHMDTAVFRSDPLHPGRGALHALLVHESVLDRMGVDVPETVSRGQMIDLVGELKKLAPTTTDAVVVPALRSTPQTLPDRRLLVQEIAPMAITAVAIAPSLMLCLTLTALVVTAPVIGFFTTASWCLQPYLVLAGTPLRPADLHASCAFRWIWGFGRWVGTALGPWQPRVPADVLELANKEYAQALAEGTTRFFETRRPDCPWCGSIDLNAILHSPDVAQRKPGHFTLEQCRQCRHIFQNPRLSPAGLEFYYRDCYDGLGAKRMDSLFCRKRDAYLSRAATLDPAAAPRRWLDVGAGQGHFCLLAQQHWPATRFDGLDMSAGIKDAERRGWVTTGIRGSFPDMAPALAGSYDVISMHHYLEHTRDPLRELKAAATMLLPGGHLLIELPNGHSRLGRLLRSRWLPWLQPQHQHFIPAENLKQALQQHGFIVVKEAYGQTHSPVDFVAAVWLTLEQAFPEPRMPWRNPQPARWRTLLRGPAIVAALPVMVIATAADRVLARVLHRTRGGNTYRLLVRKHSPDGR